jgi:hypothetical protein
MSYIGKENMCLRSLDFQSSLKYRFHNVDLKKFIINHVYTTSKPTVKTIRLTWLPSVRCKHGWLHFCVPSTHVLWPLHWHGGQLVKNHCWPGQTRSVRKFSTFVTGPLKPPGMQVPVPRFEPSSHQPQAGSSYIFETKKKRWRWFQISIKHLSGFNLAFGTATMWFACRHFRIDTCS